MLKSIIIRLEDKLRHNIGADFGHDPRSSDSWTTKFCFFFVR